MIVSKTLFGAMLIVAWVLALGLLSYLAYNYFGESGMWAVALAMVAAVVIGAHALDRGGG